MDDDKLSPIITDKLSELRFFLRRYVTLNSLCWAGIWFLAIFWLGGLVDYLPVRIGSSETPRFVRIGMLCVLSFGLLWIATVYFLPRFFRQLSPRSLAIALERHFPALGSSLVTAVELLDPAERQRKVAEVSNPAAYQAMLGEAHQEAQQRIKPLAVREVINWQPVWLSGSLLTALCLVSLAVVATQSNWTRLWASRLFGLSDTRWPRSVELRADGVEFQKPLFSGETSSSKTLLAFDEQSTVRVPAGTDVLLQIAANVDAPETPDVCTMYYRFAGGTRGRANLRKIGSPLESWQPFTLDGPPLDGVAESVDLDIVGRDGRISGLRIETVEPAVAIQMRVQCQYPEYLSAGGSGDSFRSGTELLAYRNAMRIPEGTAISLVGQSSSTLQAVEYLIVSQQASASALAQQDGEESPSPNNTTAELDIRRVETEGTDFTIPLGAITENMVVETRLIDQYGLPSGSVARYVIHVLPDTVPEVETKLVGIGSAITADAILPIAGTITDDHAVASVSVEFGTADGSLTDIPVASSTEEFATQLDLKQLRESNAISVEVGEAIGISVVATDYYEMDSTTQQAGTSGEPVSPAPTRAGRSTPKQLSIVTLDELLILLDRQELEQRQRLDIIISELRELSELLIKINSGVAEAADEAGSSDSGNLTMSRRIDIMAQQSVMQGDKSQQELSGIALSIANVQQQLVNNRTGNYDRIERLDTKVVQPLNELLDEEYAEFQDSLGGLRKQARRINDDAVPSIMQSAATARTQLDNILAGLLEIQANMLDMESFNEIVDLVRGLMDEQDELMKRTKEEQQKRVLDLFK